MPANEAPTVDGPTTTDEAPVAAVSATEEPVTFKEPQMVQGIFFKSVRCHLFLFFSFRFPIRQFKVPARKLQCYKRMKRMALIVI